MTTNELLTILEQSHPGFNRDGKRGVRTYLNLAQRMLYSVDADQLMVYDDTTGYLPSFDTTNDVFTYSLPSTVRKVSEVLVEVDNNQQSLVSGIWRQDYGRQVYNRAIEKIDISGIEYVKIPYVRTYPWSENSNAKIEFSKNPGTTENTYMYRGYKNPTDIDSDSIQPSIHPPYDFEILLPVASLLIKGVEDGDMPQYLKIIKDEYIPEMIKVFNEGDFGTNTGPVNRGY